MPLYEYLCRKGHRFEKLQRSRDVEIETCPECGIVSDRLISVVNHAFGWTLSEASHERFAKDEFVRDV